MTSANAPAIASRREIRPAGVGGKSVLARIGQAHRHRRQHAARQRVRGDQALHDDGIRKRRQRGKLGDKAHHQDQRAVGAEPAVAHDLELRGRIAAAAESVRDIRQSVLVQRAGQDRARAQRKRRRGEIRHADHPHAETEQAHRAADRRADQRKHPVARGQNSQASRLRGCGIGSRVRKATAVLRSSSHSFMIENPEGIATCSQVGESHAVR